MQPIELPLSGRRLTVEAGPDSELWLTQGTAGGPDRTRRLRRRPVCGSSFGRSGGATEGSGPGERRWFGLVYGWCDGPVRVAAIAADGSARQVPVLRLGPPFPSFWAAEATGPVANFRVTADGEEQEPVLHGAQAAELERRYGSWPLRG